MRWPAFVAFFGVLASGSEQDLTEDPEQIPYFDCWSALRIIANTNRNAHEAASSVELAQEAEATLPSEPGVLRRYSFLEDEKSYESRDRLHRHVAEYGGELQSVMILYLSVHFGRAASIESSPGFASDVSKRQVCTASHAASHLKNVASRCCSNPTSLTCFTPTWSRSIVGNPCRK